MKMEGICATCLTVGRRLALLEIKKLSLSTWLGVNITDPICWECQATIVKFITFRNRVIVAQDTLRKCEANLQSLSPLSYSYFTNDTCDELIIEGIKKEVLDCSIDCGDKDTDGDDAQNVKQGNDRKHLPASYYKTVVNNTCDIIGGMKAEVLDCDIDCIDKDTDEDDAEKVNQENVSKYLPASYCNTVVPAKPNVVNRFIIEEIKENTKKLSNNYFKIKQLNIEEVKQIRRNDLAAKRYVNSLHKCETCILGYGIDKTKWETHNSRLHSVESGSHICGLCQQRFKREDILKRHYNAHFKCYVCLHCDFAHPRYNQIHVHYSQNHYKDGYQCEKCPIDYVFPTHGRLKYHQKTVHREHPVPICLVADCGKIFKTNYSLKNHMLQHDGGTPRLECTICHKQVKGVNNLNVHMKTHTDSPPPPPTEIPYCFTCDRQFSCLKHYNLHMKYSAPHRRPDVLKFQCAHCGKKFITKHYLEDHVLSTHLNRRDFVCDVCKKTFKTKRILNRHRRKHDAPQEKIRDKVCEHCGKAFTAKKTLEEHINTHTGARPFECQVCGDRFSYSAALFNHNRLKHENFKQKINKKSKICKR